MAALLAPPIYWRGRVPVQIICQTWSPDGAGAQPKLVCDQVAYGSRSVPSNIFAAEEAIAAAVNRFTPGIPPCGAAASAAPAVSASAECAIGWTNARMGRRVYDQPCVAAVFRTHRAAGRDITAGLPWAPSHDTAQSMWAVTRNHQPNDRDALRLRCPGVSGLRPAHPDTSRSASAATT